MTITSTEERVAPARVEAARTIRSDPPAPPPPPVIGVEWTWTEAEEPEPPRGRPDWRTHFAWAKIHGGW